MIVLSINPDVWKKNKQTDVVVYSLSDLMQMNNVDRGEWEAFSRLCESLITLMETRAYIKTYVMGHMNVCFFVYILFFEIFV